MTQEMKMAETVGKKVVRKPRGKARSIGRPAGQRRIGKEFLMEKTVELLRIEPPEKLSLSMAARHAGVHLTLFKYYFKDRTRLLVDVARTLAISLGASVAAAETGGLPAPERFRIRIDAMVDFFFINPFYHRLMLEIIGDDTDPLATELISVWMSKTLDIYRGIIDSGVQEGLLRPIDPYFTFIAIMGLCEQYQHASRFSERTQADRTQKCVDIAAEYKAFVYELMLHGVGAQKADVVAKRGKSA
jgi:TetR/AcrR family transcriptional regulator